MRDQKLSLKDSVLPGRLFQKLSLKDSVLPGRLFQKLSLFLDLDFKLRKLTLKKALPIAMMETWNYRRMENIRLSDHDRVIYCTKKNRLNDCDRLEVGGIEDCRKLGTQSYKGYMCYIVPIN